MLHWQVDAEYLTGEPTRLIQLNDYTFWTQVGSNTDKSVNVKHPLECSLTGNV